MNRRSFGKLTLAGILGLFLPNRFCNLPGDATLTVDDIELFFEAETLTLNDNELVTVKRVNPRNGIITIQAKGPR